MKNRLKRAIARNIAESFSGICSSLTVLIL